jgi:hypothetical protein
VLLTNGGSSRRAEALWPMYARQFSAASAHGTQNEITKWAQYSHLLLSAQRSALDGVLDSYQNRNLVLMQRLTATKDSYNF